MNVYQKNNNDCLQASLATLLNIKYESIPAFYKYVNKGKGFYKAYTAWLKKEGLSSVTVTAKYVKGFHDNSKSIYPYFCNITGNIRCLGILQRKDRDWSHIVVLDIDERYKVKMFDPSLVGSDFTLDDLHEIEIIVQKEKI